MGKRVCDVLAALRRGVLDVEVEIEFRRRCYRGKTTVVRERYRLVGIRDAETGAYHCFLTHLTPEQLS